MIREVLYHLPFGCLVYFHKEKDELLKLAYKLKDEGNLEESRNLRNRYNRMSNKILAGMMVSISPGAIYFGIDPSILSFTVFIVNCCLAHNYSELIGGKIMRRWINEYENRVACRDAF